MVIVWCEFSVCEQWRSGDSGRPVANGRLRRRRGRSLACSSPPAAGAAPAAASAAAFTEAARLGQRRPGHELAATTAAAAEQRGRSSIITIPTLRRHASAKLAAEERVPLPGQTHLASLPETSQRALSSIHGEDRSIVGEIDQTQTDGGKTEVSSLSPQPLPDELN